MVNESELKNRNDRTFVLGDVNGGKGWSMDHRGSPRTPLTNHPSPPLVTSGCIELLDAYGDSRGTTAQDTVAYHTQRDTSAPS